MPRVGAFEVSIFGKTIYSKLKTGQWPNITTIVEQIKQVIKARNDGEDLVDVLERFSKPMQSFKNTADTLNRSINIRSQSRGRHVERAKSALRTTPLQPSDSRSKSPKLFTIRKLNKTDSNQSEVKYTRAKTPEVQRPPIERSRTPVERTRSPAEKPSMRSTLYIRDKIRRESDGSIAGNSVVNESNSAVSRGGSRNFRSQRYNFSKNPRASEVVQTDSSFLPTNEDLRSHPPSLNESQSLTTEAHENSMILQEIVSQETNRLTSLVLQGYEHQLVPAKSFLGESDSKKINSIQQSKSSTQDPEDRLPPKRESFSNDEGLLINTDELVNKYHSLSATNSLSFNFQPELSNTKLSGDQYKLMIITSSTEAMGNNQSLQSLEYRDSLGPMNSFPKEQENGLEVPPDTFRVQTDKVSPKFVQMYETPKYIEKKDFFQMDELQKTAQFCKPTTTTLPMKEFTKIFPRRVSSRGSNRYQTSEDSDFAESGSYEMESKGVSAGNINTDSGHLTFRNTSANEVMNGSNQLSNYSINQRESNDSVRIKADTNSIDFEDTGDFNQIKYPDPQPNTIPKASQSRFRKKRYEKVE